MKTIGVTGGIGAGKSTVLSILEQEYDACVIQADLIGHEVMMPGGSCYEAVLALFGPDVLKNDKTIDRKKVSDVVFHVAEMREKLSGIIHPAVKKEILRRLAGERSRGRLLCVVEAALLLEDRYQDFLDEIWYVHAETEVRIRRLMESRGYTREKCESVIRSQADESFYRAHADLVIDNGRSLAYTRSQITERLKQHETM